MSNAFVSSEGIDKSNGLATLKTYNSTRFERKVQPTNGGSKGTDNQRYLGLLNFYNSYLQPHPMDIYVHELDVRQFQSRNLLQQSQMALDF